MTKEELEMRNKYEKNRNNTGKKGLSNKVRLGFLAIIELLSVIFVNYLVGFVTNIIGIIIYVGDSKVSGAVSAKRMVAMIDKFVNNTSAAQEWLSLIEWRNALSRHPIIFSSLFLVLMSLVTIFLFHIFIRNRNINQNQYGHAQLASRHDIKKQYKAVPKQQRSFSGIGGLPVATDHKHYYIDTDTTNNLIVGKTRSGKGEAFIFPLIDILSRGTEKPALIINDPKEELYRSSYITLRKRGYEVHRLNLKDPTNSIGYNPLQRVIDLAKLGYYDEVQQEINKITSAIYDDPFAKDKFWIHSSIFLMNSLILALLNQATQDNDYSYVNMYTAVTMLTRLGGSDINITDQSGKVIGKKNLLIVYFESLAELPSAPFKDMAINAFQQSKFAGEETAGNIYSSAMEKVQIYQQTNIAKLTGKSTIKLENIGFSRVLTIKLSNSDYHHLNATVTIKTNEEIIEKHTVEVDQVGVINVPFKAILPDKFEVVVDFKESNVNLVADDHIDIIGHKIYKREQGAGILSKPIVDQFTNKKVLEGVQLKIKPSTSIIGDVTYLNFAYNDKPLAIFLETPIDNPSYNSVASFFIDQLFNTANALAISAGGKTYNRIHFIIDEFANLPKVPYMDRKVTLSLGMNIVWTLIVQNLEQLQINYSKQEAATIKDNCGNKVYLLSDSIQTAKEFSQYIGEQTISVSNIQTNTFRMRASNNKSLIKQDLLNYNDLLQLQQGENVIVRSSKRTNNRDKKIIAYPIFNHGKHAFPFRYQLPVMKSEFNTDSPMSVINSIPDVDRVKTELADITINNWHKFFNKVFQPEIDQNGLDSAIENEPVRTTISKKDKQITNFIAPDILAEISTSKLNNLIDQLNRELLENKEITDNVPVADLKAISKDLTENFAELNINVNSSLIGKYPQIVQLVRKFMQTETMKRQEGEQQ